MHSPKVLPLHTTPKTQGTNEAEKVEMMMKREKWIKANFNPPLCSSTLLGTYPPKLRRPSLSPTWKSRYTTETGFLGDRREEMKLFSNDQIKIKNTKLISFIQEAATHLKSSHLTRQVNKDA